MEYNYNGLNYMFRHNFDQALDAQHVGNETRFVNHAVGKKANVTADSESQSTIVAEISAHLLAVRLVNGEQKIGFTASESRSFRVCMA